MNIRPYLIFVVAVYSVSVVKTLCMAAVQPETDSATAYLLVKDGRGKRLLYPVLEGSDIQMPFTKSVEASSRTFGFSKLIYAVYSGTSLRDTRYPTFWR